jgi:hypothetical protein
MLSVQDIRKPDERVYFSHEEANGYAGRTERELTRGEIGILSQHDEEQEQP